MIMTALAMIIGMVPMALGLGDGGEQNAPLGRAVIGGLLCATVATLLFVPSVFALIHGSEKSEQARAEESPCGGVRMSSGTGILDSEKAMNTQEQASADDRDRRCSRARRCGPRRFDG